MMNKSAEKLILALETGIDGGSVAVLQDEKLVCHAEGTGKVSRSEDLLILIDQLLTENGLEKKQIGLIAVSGFPGSLTGIRIGLATAAGLGDSIAALVLKLPVLEALVYLSAAKDRTMAALSSEKNGIYFCQYDKKGAAWSPEKEVLNERDPENFIRQIIQENITGVVLDKKLGDVFSNMPGADMINKNKNVQIIEGSPAEIIGRAAKLQIASDNEMRIV